MGSKSAEIAREQAYFDIAHNHRERARGVADATPDAAAHAGAAAQLRKQAKARREAMGRADEAVAFGRMDSESGERLYVGKHLIRDEDSEVLVINWQTPAAAAFYQASHSDPLGLIRK